MMYKSRNLYLNNKITPNIFIGIMWDIPEIYICLALYFIETELQLGESILTIDYRKAATWLNCLLTGALFSLINFPQDDTDIK